jgi:hypothetical protein
MANEFAGSGDNASNIAWLRAEIACLRAEYGDVPSRFPPASVVCFEGDEQREFVVIGYVYFGAMPSVILIDLAEMRCTAYEDFPKKARRVCPHHELPRLRYLYNRNGKEYAAKFRA